MDKAIYASTWDLVDDGRDQVIERIRALGLNSITLHASEPAGAALWRQHAPERAASPADGPILFRARPERYGHIKPRVHPVVSACDALAELQRAAPDLGRAAFVACPYDAPFDPPPEYLSRNAFGAPYARRLCPAHPAVRDYVVNLCSDLAHGYDLATVILEMPGWLTHDRGFHAELAAAPLDRCARALLSLCFADTTRHAAQAAGIDADRLQAEARQLLERYAADVAPSGMAAAWWLADLLSDPEWVAFLDWRCRLLSDLVGDIKVTLPAGTALAVLPPPTQGSAAWMEGCDLAMLAGAADALEIPAFGASAELLYLDMADRRRRAGAGAALRFVLRPAHAERGDGAQTGEAVRRLNQIGCVGIAFYDYDHVRRDGLAAVKAALDALGSP